MKNTFSRVLLTILVVFLLALIGGAVAWAEPSGLFTAYIHTWSEDLIVVKANQVANWNIKSITAHLEFYNATEMTNYVLDFGPGDCGIYYLTTTAVCIMPVEFEHDDWYLITYTGLEVPSGIYVHHAGGVVDSYWFEGAPEPIRADFRLKMYFPTVKGRPAMQPDPWPYP